jgi:hypothetical protein
MSAIAGWATFGRALVITPEKRNEFIGIHVPYEIDMLVHTFKQLEEDLAAKLAPRADESDKKTMRNALIEAFCLHARNLFYFFKDKQGSKATDYAQPYQPTAVNNIDDEKIQTQIAHLSETRTDDPTKKIGPDERKTIMLNLITEIHCFSQALKKEFRPLWPYTTAPTSLAKSAMLEVSDAAIGASSSIEQTSFP